MVNYNFLSGQYSHWFKGWPIIVRIQQGKNKGKKTGNGPEQLPDVVPADAQQSIDEVSCSAFETVALHGVLMLQLSDHRLYGRPPLPPSLDGCRNCLPIPVGYQDCAIPFIIVTPIPKITGRLIRMESSDSLHLILPFLFDILRISKHIANASVSA